MSIKLLFIWMSSFIVIMLCFLKEAQCFDLKFVVVQSNTKLFLMKPGSSDFFLVNQSFVDGTLIVLYPKSFAVCEYLQ